MKFIYKPVSVTKIAVTSIAAVLTAASASAPVPSLAASIQDSPLDRKSGGPILPPSKRVLADGEPPLTEAMATRYAEFVTWLLEVDITPADRDRFRAILIKDWTGPKRQTDIKTDLEALSTRDQVMNQPAHVRELFRQRTMPGLVKELRQKAADGDADGRWLLGRYESAHRPLVPGNPPLTPQVAAASAEMICFMASEARGYKVEVTPDFAASSRKALMEHYPRLSAAQKREMAGLPQVWAELQAAWSVAPEKDREEMRVSWRQQFGSKPSTAMAAKDDDAAFLDAARATRDDELLPAPPTAYLQSAAKTKELAAAKARAEGKQALASANERAAKRLQELAKMPREKRPRLTKRELMAMPFGKIPVEYFSVRSSIWFKEANEFSQALTREQNKHIGNMGIFAVYRSIL